MKKILSILLLLSILLQTFSKLIVYVGYEINKDYISKNLCENRNKPEMNCYGKCHLKKQLKESDKKESSSSEKKTKEKNEIQFLSVDVPLLRPLFANTTDKYYSFIFSLEHTYLSSIFHPPQG